MRRTRPQAVALTCVESVWRAARTQPTHPFIQPASHSGRMGAGPIPSLCALKVSITGYNMQRTHGGDAICNGTQPARPPNTIAGK